MSTCLRFFHTVSIESINITHLFTLKFLSYFVKITIYNQIEHSQFHRMKNMTEKQVKKIKQRIVEACKNDSSHTKKMSADSE